MVEEKITFEPRWKSLLFHFLIVVFEDAVNVLENPRQWMLDIQQWCDQIEATGSHLKVLPQADQKVVDMYVEEALGVLTQVPNYKDTLRLCKLYLERLRSLYDAEKSQ